MYEFLLRQAETKTSAGWIFEARMHIVFERGGPSKATKQGGLTTITIDIGHKPYKSFSKVSELGSLLRKESGSPSINPNIIGVYFRPQHCNFCSVDSFAVATFATTNETGAGVIPNDSEHIAPCQGTWACEYLGGNTCGA
jgi:hypothetical protein